METERKISTFVPNEKEIMKKLDNFEQQINDTLQEGESISNIEYYEKLKITEELEVNENIYIVEIKQEDGTTRTGIYAINSNNLLGFLNENGKIEFIDPLLRTLEVEMTIEDLKELNYENIRAKAEELTPEEMEKFLENKKENDEREDEDQTEKSKESKNMEKKIEEETGKKYEFSYYREIRTPGLQEGLESAKGKTCALASDKITGQMMIIDTEKGEVLQGTETGKVTMRTAITLNDNAQRVERKNLHALIKTNEKNKEVGITLGKYGEPELYAMEVTPCGERIAERVGMKGQTREDVDLEQKRKINNPEEKHEVTHNYEETEGITEDTEIELGEETTTIRKEAEKDNVTPEEFLNKYKVAEGNNPKEKIENVHEEIEREYVGPKRERH